MTRAADPFGERRALPHRAELSILGGAFTVESEDAALLELATDAFGGLPEHRLTDDPRRFRLSVVAGGDEASWPSGAEPPRPMLSAGAALLCAMIDASSFAVIDPALSRALVSVSRRLLAHRYHARYELVELACVTLASRAQSLVPLHAACIGSRGMGLLLVGSSGAGKSTLALHALLAGMELVSEDSAFVELDGLHVTGVPSYVHVRPDALERLPDGPLVERIRRSPVIRRRSGQRKHEVNLREMPGRLAAAPLKLAGVVFLSAEPARRKRPIEPLDRAALLPCLRREQPYAAGLDDWRAFEERIAGLPAYTLYRAGHPDAAVAELDALLAAARGRP